MLSPGAPNLRIRAPNRGQGRGCLQQQQASCPRLGAARDRLADCAGGEGECARNCQADGDPHDAGRPGGGVDRAEGIVIPVRVVIVTVVLAVIVGEVMGDSALVARGVGGVVIGGHGRHSGRRPGWVPRGGDSP